MSSRNGYLTAAERAEAPRLYATLRGIADAILDGRSQIVQQIVSDEFVEVDSSDEQAPP